MNYKQLLNKCVADAKVKYPNSEFIKQYDVDYNISHLSVIEIFEPLDMVEWGSGEVIKWNDEIYYSHGMDYTDVLYDDMMSYFETMMDMEV